MKRNFLRRKKVSTSQMAILSNSVENAISKRCEEMQKEKKNVRTAQFSKNTTNSTRKVRKDLQKCTTKRVRLDN